MSEINQTVADICAGIRASSAIQTWAEIRYGKACEVQNGCDSRDLPGVEKCPAVIVVLLAEAGGLNGEPKKLVLGVSVWVNDSGRPESIEKVLSYDGERNLVELKQLVVDEIVAHLPDRMDLADINTEYREIDFPVMSADMELLITETKLIGHNNPYR